jgi:hypothetical protein
MKRTLLLCLLLCLCLLGLKEKAWGQAGEQVVSAGEVPADTLIERKSPMGALLRSVAFPGWGQFYNKKYTKAVVVFGAETTFITLAAIEWSRMNKHKKNFQNPDYPDRYWEFEQFKFYEDRRNTFLWITAGIVFLSMFDAYVDAHLYNFDREQVRDLSIGFTSGENDQNEMRIVLSIQF